MGTMVYRCTMYRHTMSPHAIGINGGRASLCIQYNTTHAHIHIHTSPSHFPTYTLDSISAVHSMSTWIGHLLPPQPSFPGCRLRHSSISALCPPCVGLNLLASVPSEGRRVGSSWVCGGEGRGGERRERGRGRRERGGRGRGRGRRSGCTMG